MRKIQLVIASAAVCGFILSGCHDDHGGQPTPPPAPSGTDFETYATNLVENSTCDTAAPVETNNIDFSFSANQDTADPRDVSMVSTGCQASS